MALTFAPLPRDATWEWHGGGMDSPPPLSRRDALWVLRRCGRRGHQLVWLADPLAADLQRTAENPVLLRCLRCGTFVETDDPATAGVRGTQQAPVPLGEVPLAVRGSHGRKLALLRVVAVERVIRALMLLVAAGGIFALGANRDSVVAKVNAIITSAYPLAEQVGWDIRNSHLIATVQELLGENPVFFTLLGAAFVGYAILQLVEAFGLWGGWRWAEYLAVVATSVFIPLEIYEILNRPTPFKITLFAVNVAIVVYLIWKGRLFGVRGGHGAYLAEIRDSTLLGAELRAAGRSPQEQSGTVLV